jgi:crotonobetainyl-CoA:carnitine CoA-transferase CaiB-like acyl-CoA transferase
LLAERRMIVETEHPDLGAVRQLAGLVRVGEFRPVHRRGPMLGEDTDQVLHDLMGIDMARRDELASAGAFGARAELTGTKRKEAGA